MTAAANKTTEQAMEQNMEQQTTAKKRMNLAMIKDKLGDIEDGLTAIEALTLANACEETMNPHALANSCDFITRTLRKCLQEITDEIEGAEG